MYVPPPTPPPLTPPIKDPPISPTHLHSPTHPLTYTYPCSHESMLGNRSGTAELGCLSCWVSWTSLQSTVCPLRETFQCRAGGCRRAHKQSQYVPQHHTPQHSPRMTEQRYTFSERPRRSHAEDGRCPREPHLLRDDVAEKERCDTAKITRRLRY